MKVVWSRPALANLDSAYRFISEDHPGAAARVIGRIKEAVKALQRHPEIGRPGRLEGTRELVVAGTPFIVAYIVERDAVVVFGLVHGARRWPDAF